MKNREAGRAKKVPAFACTTISRLSTSLLNFTVTTNKHDDGLENLEILFLTKHKTEYVGILNFLDEMVELD